MKHLRLCKWSGIALCPCTEMAVLTRNLLRLGVCLCSQDPHRCHADVLHCPSHPSCSPYPYPHKTSTIQPYTIFETMLSKRLFFESKNSLCQNTIKQSLVAMINCQYCSLSRLGLTDESFKDCKSFLFQEFKRTRQTVHINAMHKLLNPTSLIVLVSTNCYFVNGSLTHCATIRA